MTVKEAVDLFSHEMINEIYHSILPSTLLTFLGFNLVFILQESLT